MMKLNIQFTSLLIAAMFATSVQAQQLYKWVDAEGVTHYADSLPEQHTEHQSFKFADYQSSKVDSDYYSIQNQLQRLQQRRAEAIKQKKQLAEIRAAENPPVQEVVVVSPPERRYYAPAYYPNGIKYGFNRHNYSSKSKYHNQTKRQSPIEKPRTGLVSKAKNTSSKAVFAATK